MTTSATSTHATQVTPEALQALRRPSEPVMSPDGTRVAFALSHGACTDPPDGAQGSIWITEGDAPPVQATRGPGLDIMPRWSPDGRALAFGSDREHAGRMSVYILRDAVSEAEPVGEVAGSVEDIAWSRDGKRLLVLVADIGADRAGNQNATRIADEHAPEPDPRISRPGKVWRRLLRIDVENGLTTEVGPEALNVWEFDWDGDSIAVAVVSADPLESGWYAPTLAVMDLERRAVTARYRPTWQLGAPRLSPDGRRVVFTEGFCSDRNNVTSTPMCAEIDGPKLTAAPLTEELDDVQSMAWRDAQTLWYVRWRGLGTACGRLCLDGSVEELWAGDATLGIRYPRVSADAAGGKLAAIHEAANEPPEVVTLDVASSEHGWRPATAFNGQLRELDLPEWRAYRWASFDGLEVEGLLALPPGREPRDLPLVVIVHGGPTSSWTFSWTNFGMPLLWTAAGYVVLMPNPRGSRGYGAEFAQANLGDMGGGDFGDILAGVDALVASGIADTARVGILGASYGGFMSAWAVGQTDRFAAAIPMACVSDWLSFHNTSNVGRFDRLFLDADPYDPDGAYFERSPITHARNMRTPTLIVHGENDLCTPVGQAQELYQAIAGVGQTEVELVVYPREGHGTHERAHQVDLWNRARAWFDRYLSGDQETSGGQQ